MAVKQLTLKSLEELGGGKVSKAFLQHIARIVQDCIDRPKDKKPRTVTMEFECVPVLTQDSKVMECEGVSGDFRIKSKVPQHRSKTFEFRCNNQGQLSFSTESPESFDQATLDDLDPETGKVNRKKE